MTHEEVTRYFMTIQGAAQLVIQAGAMAEGCEVFVLDMGEPIKIRDLAELMVQLSGKTVRNGDNPDGEIEIEFRRLRPGEKLYEELLITDSVVGTEHPKIMRADERNPASSGKIFELLDRLEAQLDMEDTTMLRQTLQDVVEGYDASGGLDRVRGAEIVDIEQQRSLRAKNN